MKGYTLQKRQTKTMGIRWTAHVRVPPHEPIHKTFGRKKDAEKWAIEEATRLRCGGVAGKEKLSEVVERYLAKRLEERIKRDRDRRRRAVKLAWWVEQLGDPEMREVSRVEIARTYEEKAGETSAATANRYLSALSAVFTYAVSQSYADENPCRKVEKLSEPKGRVRYLSNRHYEPNVAEPDEYTRLLGAVQDFGGPVLYAMTRFAIETGARQGEIANLTWDDVRGNVCTFKDTKNTDSRSVVVSDEMLKLMRSLPARIDRHVFTDDFEKHRDDWNRAVEEAELDAPFRFHDLRHTCASYLAMSGASLLVLKETLGHKTLAMVQRYAHLAEGHVHDALLRMVSGLREGS